MTSSPTNKPLREEVDDYEETISAIVSFCHFVRWDKHKQDFKKGSYFFIGRKMDETSKNQITPDFVIQFNETYGIVGEAKKSFSRNDKFWIKDFEQLQKYDTALKGWKTHDEFIKTSDIVLLTHYSRKVDVTDYLQEKISKGAISFNNNFVVIAFSRIDQSKTFIYLEKAFGNLSDKTMDDKIRKIVKIPLDRILPFYNIRFYDAKPPLPLTMSILWNNMFNQIPPVEQFMDSDGRKQIKIEVNVDDLTEKMRHQFAVPQNNDHRLPEIPKTSWIRESMEMFLKLKYVTKKIGSNDDYIVKYKSMKEPLETFASKIAEDQQRTLNQYEK